MAFGAGAGAFEGDAERTKLALHSRQLDQSDRQFVAELNERRRRADIADRQNEAALANRREEFEIDRSMQAAEAVRRQDNEDRAFKEGQRTFDIQEERQKRRDAFGEMADLQAMEERKLQYAANMEAFNEMKAQKAEADKKRAATKALVESSVGMLMRASFESENGMATPEQIDYFRKRSGDDTVVSAVFDRNSQTFALGRQVFDGAGKPVIDQQGNPVIEFKVFDPVKQKMILDNTYEGYSDSLEWLNKQGAVKQQLDIAQMREERMAGRGAASKPAELDWYWKRELTKLDAEYASNVEAMDIERDKIKKLKPGKKERVMAEQELKRLEKRNAEIDERIAGMYQGGGQAQPQNVSGGGIDKVALLEQARRDAKGDKNKAFELYKAALSKAQSVGQAQQTQAPADSEKGWKEVSSPRAVSKSDQLPKKQPDRAQSQKNDNGENNWMPPVRKYGESQKDWEKRLAASKWIPENLVAEMPGVKQVGEVVFKVGGKIIDSARNVRRPNETYREWRKRVEG